MADKEEIERLMRTARVRVRELEAAFDGGDFKKVVQDAYNVMFMAARATVNHLGANATSHRAVASIFRKELIGRHLVNKKYQDHLRKITGYRDEVMKEGSPEIDQEKAQKIIQASKDFVKILTEVIEKNPEPVIDYDITDFA